MNDFEDFKYRCLKRTKIPPRSFGPSALALPPPTPALSFPGLIPVLGSLKQSFSGVNRSPLGSLKLLCCSGERMRRDCFRGPSA